MFDQLSRVTSEMQQALDGTPLEWVVDARMRRSNRLRNSRVRGCEMRIGRRLRSGYGTMDARDGARWMIERARAARDAGLDSLFVGDHHNVPVPYYQNVPMLGRLLAEWDDRPAGALFLLPLWHPVLVAEQIGTLASIAPGRFIMQCALGGGARAVRRVRRLDDATARRRFEAALDIVRRLCAGEEVTAEAPYRIARRAHRAGAAGAARGVDRRGGAARDRSRRPARRRVPRRAGGDTGRGPAT